VGGPGKLGLAEALTGIEVSWESSDRADAPQLAQNFAASVNGVSHCVQNIFQLPGNNSTSGF
jgi:hypothetical protein